MFDISYDGLIIMSRGDTVRMPLFINAGTEISPYRYILKDTDKVYFGISEPNKSFENAIVRKVYTKYDWVIDDNGDLVIIINPTDTEYLTDGLYYYMIKLVSNNDGVEEVQTIIPKTKLYIGD